MSESIGTARLDIVVDTSSLDAGVNKAKRSTQDMSKAAQDASQRMDAGTKRQVAALERQIATLGKSRSEVIRWRIEQQTSGRVAAELTAKLDAQSRSLASTNSIYERIGFAAGRLAKNFALLGAAATTAAIGFGIKNAVDFADQLNDINQRLGISAEALSGWAFAAKQTGTDIDGLGIGLKKLAKNMGEATNATSSQGKLFAALGVQVKDAQGNLRRMEDVLPEIATKFKAIQNETLKAALAQELFGKSGTDLIEFLNQGADGLDGMRDKARELGVELSQGTLTAADNFNDKVSELKSATQGLFTQLAVALLPELTKLTEKLTELVADGDRTKSFVHDLSTVVSGTANVFEFAASQVAVMINQLAALRSVAEGVINLDWSAIKRGLSQGLAGQFQSVENASRFISGQPQRRKDAVPPGLIQEMDISLGAPMSDKERAAFERRLTGALGGGGGSKKAKKEGKSDAEKELERLEAAYKSLAAQQLENIALFGKEGEAAKVRYETENGALKGLSDAKKRELIANAERIDQLRSEADVQKELDRINKAREERADDVLADIKAETDLLGKSVEYQDTYNKLKYAGVDANSAFGQSIIQANEALHQQARVVADQVSAMDATRESVRGLFGDIARGKDILDSVTDALDNFAERLTDIISQRLVEQLFGQQGTNQTGSAGSWFGTLLGSLFGGGSANGNAFQNGQVMAFANGGVFDRPTFFGMSSGRFGVMGENGPEAIMPLERGRDGRLGVRASGGGETITNVRQEFHTHIQGRLDRSTQEQMDRRTGTSAARGISRTGRRS